MSGKGTSGAAATGHPETTRAAIETLRAGGNAFDAAIAAGFASSVAEPSLTSLGGGGFLLSRTVDGESTLYDFFTRTPGLGASVRDPHFVPVNVPFGPADQVFHVGMGAAAVPGCLRGYLRVHERLGILPLEQILAPAVQLAREGIALSEEHAYVHRILKNILTMRPEGRALFAPAGRLLEAGDVFCNEALGAFLETLPVQGSAALYTGPIAARIASDMHAGSGLITEQDLENYDVIEREPLSLNYRGRTILTNPPPSLGGPLIGLSLELLESIQIGDLRYRGPAHISTLAHLMQEVERLRSNEADLGQARTRLREFSRGTTHVSVIDANGNAAAMTTSNGEACGYVVPDTGIMLNNMLGEDDLHPHGFHSNGPGEQMASMMSPTLVLDGNRTIAIGSGGSKRIRTAIMRVISDVVDFGQPIQQAIDTSRVHLDGERLEIEPGLPADTLAALRSRWYVNEWPTRNMYFGGVHAVAGSTDGGADSRRTGSFALA